MMVGMIGSLDLNPGMITKRLFVKQYPAFNRTLFYEVMPDISFIVAEFLIPT